MTKRPLTTEEKHITQKAVIKYGEERTYQEYLLEHANLMLNKGITQNYLLQLSEYRIKKRRASADIQELTTKIHTLKNQLQEGVETKESEQ